MKYAVRYFTMTGNTKRLAEAVAKELGVEALPIDMPVDDKVDVLFLGNSYYAFSIAPEVAAFVSSLDKDKVGKIVNFGTAAMLKSTFKKVRKVADKAGIPVLDQSTEEIDVYLTVIRMNILETLLIAESFFWQEAAMHVVRILLMYG